MQPSRVPLLLALITFGLSLTSGLWAYNQFLRMVPVLVAEHDVPAGTALAPEMVRVERVPAGSTPPEALYGPGQVVGMSAAVPLLAGHIVSARQVTGRAVAPEVAVAVSAGQRVVSVPVKPEAALAGALRRGDLVDVAVASPTADGRTVNVEVLLSGVKVVDLRDAAGRPAGADGAAGSAVAGPGADGPVAGARVETAAAGPPTAVLLLVTGAQAKTLTAAAESKATIYLWLAGREGQ